MSAVDQTANLGVTAQPVLGLLENMVLPDFSKTVDPSKEHTESRTQPSAYAWIADNVVSCSVRNGEVVMLS